MLDALQRHWPEYLMEAVGLGLFMISACVFTVLLWHPGSPALAALPDAMVRRALTGIAMGLTAIGIIYSPWGKRSGAHLNPSVTLTFLRLGKLRPWDAVFYMAAQFAGGLAGVLLAAVALGDALAAPAVNFAATTPGPRGVGAAFLAEFGISFGLMGTVLLVSNAPRVARYTGVCAGVLVAIYITFEAPLSGMSMNPARTFGSALPAATWMAIWIYFAAPPLGMLAAAQCYVKVKGAHAVLCAKLHHDNPHRCIFHCAFPSRAVPDDALRPPLPPPGKEDSAGAAEGRGEALHWGAGSPNADRT